MYDFVSSVLLINYNEFWSLKFYYTVNLSADVSQIFYFLTSFQLKRECRGTSAPHHNSHSHIRRYSVVNKYIRSTTDVIIKHILQDEVTDIMLWTIYFSCWMFANLVNITKTGRFRKTFTFNIRKCISNFSLIVSGGSVQSKWGLDYPNDITLGAKLTN